MMIMRMVVIMRMVMIMRMMVMIMIMMMLAGTRSDDHYEEKDEGLLAYSHKTKSHYGGLLDWVPI